MGFSYLGFAGIAGGMLFARVALAVHLFYRRGAVHGVLFRYGEHPEPEMTGGAEHGNVIWNDCGRGGAGNLHYRGGRGVAEPLAIAAARNR